MQQLRWPPTLIADTAAQALQRLFVLPGSHYEGPEFSWRWAVAPAAIGFAGSGLGPQHAHDLFVGAARTFLDEGYLFEFKFDQTRQHFAFTDPAVADQVDDNDYKFDEGESESLVAGATTSASSPTSLPAPTATCTSPRSPTAPSTKSAPRVRSNTRRRPVMVQDSVSQPES